MGGVNVFAEWRFLNFSKWQFFDESWGFAQKIINDDELIFLFHIFRNTVEDFIELQTSFACPINFSCNFPIIRKFVCFIFICFLVWYLPETIVNINWVKIRKPNFEWTHKNICVSLIYIAESGKNQWKIYVCMIQFVLFPKYDKLRLRREMLSKFLKVTLGKLEGEKILHLIWALKRFSRGKRREENS